MPNQDRISGRLEQAAADYAPAYENMYNDDAHIMELLRTAFKAGANWQKEQYKDIKEALELGHAYMILYMQAKGQNINMPAEIGSNMDKVLKALKLLQD